ncbi:MAG: dTDP-4-amino-4,6-dideoxygalactose transaminase [Actinomycetes bacterium]
MIPFNRAQLFGAELAHMQRALANGHISGGGPFNEMAEDILGTYMRGSRALLTTSCTHALELASRVLELGKGDEVIVPAFTFVSTASAFALSGATPVFADVSDRTLGLTLDAIKGSFTPRTRAVCVVHYAGVPTELEEISAWCQDQGVTLIEDNAHGLGSTLNGRPLGTFGSLSTLSFHETKNITCGEGGALVVNHKPLIPQAEILREKGTDRSQFIRGQIDKYTWQAAGSSWVLSDMLAAFLVGQLEMFEDIQMTRKSIWNFYEASLGTWAQENGVRTPTVPDQVDHSAHMYFLRLPDHESRSRFIDHMSSRGVMTVFHYQALNASPMGIKLGGISGSCPVAEELSGTLVRLPLFATLTPFEQQSVVHAAIDFKV